MPEHEFKIRLKLPSGAEMEAAGSRDFVTTERETFLNTQAAANETNITMRAFSPAKAVYGNAKSHSDGSPDDRYNIGPDWQEIIESKAGRIQLRAKLRSDAGDKEACLVLLEAAKQVLNIQKPTAAQLAKWLRASGYPVQRVDRAIASAITKGEILASGSRRARRYELTGPGRLKAFLLAEQLSAAIIQT